MLLTARHPFVGTYGVEVSGWDSEQSFFVEKTELEWREESGKQITLSRRLNMATMIFVRLLQPTAADRSCPVAYQAEYLAAITGDLHQFRLSQAAPRNAANEKSLRSA
jgi:hypothetical protein